MAVALPPLYPYYEPPINPRDMLHTPDEDSATPFNSLLHPTTPQSNADEEMEDSVGFAFGADDSAVQQDTDQDMQEAPAEQEHSMSLVSGPLVPHPPKRPPAQHQLSFELPDATADQQQQQQQQQQLAVVERAPQVPWRVSRFAERNPQAKRPWKPVEQPAFNNAGAPTFAMLLHDNERLKQELAEAERDDRMLEDALLRRRIQRRFKDIDVSQLSEEMLQQLASRMDAEKNLQSGEYSDWRDYGGIAEKKYMKQMMQSVETALPPAVDKPGRRHRNKRRKD
jgi:hypothetical protein|eukprot:CAMPEP_0174346242 /NCGR_PEP_ID=MMETSP0811_2-20130205/1890_1 /TAXON_ID=73025 ORGANISM="Eutreptiella gymnastica-like, Strain CCMP1594" /NCGR_SAMPLE_ID=MMETSP0811_2 /ASSEMBLY_ACC=CAM_ASM_000667 /LENGTH=281 /DNA_ID=CAMNT_0015470637 /DNA_START=105 /DNA_END=950 /DNA_ORIENTATION=+